MKDRLGKILLNKRIKAVLPHVSGRLLDIGCGTNSLVKTYNGNGVGVDVFQWGGADLIVKDTSSLPFDSGSFDTITIIASLNHIPNREAVLAEAHRLLTKDGTLIVTMIPPVVSRVWHFLRKPWDADQHERGMKPGEVYGIPAKRVKQLLSQSGFNVISEEYISFPGFNRLTIAKITN